MSDSLKNQDLTGGPDRGRRSLLLGLAAGAASSLLAPQLGNAQALITEGTDYEVIQSPLVTESEPGKIEVREFFGYWCPHCNDFEPALNDWARRQSSGVVLAHTPWAFQSSQVPYQRLFYTLEILGKETQLRARVFGAIHIDHVVLDNVNAQADWAAKNGLDAAKFREIYESFTVQTKTQRASQMASQAGVSGVPTLVVNGKYIVMRGNPLPVVDYLIGLERRQAPAARKA